MAKGDHRVDKTPTVDPSGLFSFRKVKRDGQLLGFTRNYKHKWNGKQISIYWAARRADEIFYKTGCWAIGVATVTTVSQYAVDYLGVLVEDGRRLLIKKADVLALKGGIYRDNFEHRPGLAPGAQGKPGANYQFFILESQFAIEAGTPEEGLQALLARMLVKDTRRTRPTRGPAVAASI